MGVYCWCRCVLLFLLCINTTIQAQNQLQSNIMSTNNVHGQGGTPWAIPFGVFSEDYTQQSSSAADQVPPKREFFASALVYDSESDRVYVTGVSYNRRTSYSDSSNSDMPSLSPIANDDDSQFNDDVAAYDDDNYDDDGYDDSVSNSTNIDSDCFLGILQVPRRSSNDVDVTSQVHANDWIRQHTTIGTQKSKEACSGIDIVRRGNDRKVYLIGHSILGPSVLEEHLYWYNTTHQLIKNSTTISSNNNITNTTTTNTSSVVSTQPVVYGFVVDVTWYNGQVPTGYLMHHVPVEYPIGIKASSVSSDNDIYVASIQSLTGMVNPAHNLYQMTNRQTDSKVTNSTDSILYDTTTAGAYIPPEYGERYSFRLRRIGERSRTISDIMTLPQIYDNTNNSTITYQSKENGSKFLNLMKLASQIKSQGIEDFTTYDKSTVGNGTSTINTTNVNATIATSNITVTNTSDSEVLVTPPSYDAYRFVVEPLVEKWGRTFSDTKMSMLPSSVYSVQVSSLLHCTITTTEETTNGSDDDSMDDDSTIFVQRQQSMIVVAGSTRGSGVALGGDIGSTSLHGFVSSFDTISGVMLRSIPITTNTGVDTSGMATGTVSHKTGYTVRVLGMCQPDPISLENVAMTYHSSNYIYIVGMTDGILDHSTYSSIMTPRVGVYHAFIQKIEVTTFSVEWTRQLGAAKFSNSSSSPLQYGSIHGISCAVTPDGLHVYLGGTVINGAAITMDEGKTFATTSLGSDDIFVAQYLTSDGVLNYVKQIGTVQDDTIANGESLATDKYGNAILLGNTRGLTQNTFVVPYLYNRVVVLSIERSTGNHVDFGARAQPTQPDETPSSPQNATDSRQPTIGPTATSGNNTSLSLWSDLSKINSVYLAILSILTVAIIVSLFLSLRTWQQRNRNEKLITRYLLSLASDQDEIKNKHQSSNDEEPIEDVERAKLFTDDTERTDSCQDDGYETVCFIPSKQYGGPPPQSLNDEDETSSYHDTLLNSSERSGSRRNNYRGIGQVNAHFVSSDDASSHPLYRWLKRDP